MDEVPIAYAVNADAVNADAVVIEEHHNLLPVCRDYINDHLVEILTTILLGKLTDRSYVKKSYFANLITRVKELNCNIEDINSLTFEQIEKKNKKELINLIFGIIRKLAYTDFQNKFTADILIEVGNLGQCKSIKNNNSDKQFCKKLYDYFKIQYSEKHTLVEDFINRNNHVKALLKNFMNPDLANNLKGKKTWIDLFAHENMIELLNMLDVNISKIEEENNVSTSLLSNYFVLFLYFLTSINENITDSLKNYVSSSDYSIKESDKIDVFEYKTKLDARQNLAIQRFSSFSNKDDKCCFLFHGVGTGKTITSLSIALSYLEERNLKTTVNPNPIPFKILIVAPTGLFYSSFKNDCSKLGIYTYAPELDQLPFEKFIGFTKGEKKDTEYLIEFIGYDYDSFFDENRQDYGFVKNLSGLEFDAFICDESHRLLKKNIDENADMKFFLNTTNRKMNKEKGVVRNTLSDHRFYSFIKQKIKTKSIFLTGTPFQKSYYDMISIALFLNTDINSSNKDSIINDSVRYGNFTGLFLPLSNPSFFIEKYGRMQSFALSVFAGTFKLFQALSDGLYKNKSAIGSALTTYLFHTYGPTIFSFVGKYGFEIITQFMPVIISYIVYFRFTTDTLSKYIMYCIPTIIMLSTAEKDEFVVNMIKELKERSGELHEFDTLKNEDIKFARQELGYVDDTTQMTDVKVVNVLLKPAFDAAIQKTKTSEGGSMRGRDEIHGGGDVFDTIQFTSKYSESELINAPLVNAFLLNMTPRNFIQIAKANVVEDILIKIDPNDLITTGMNIRDRIYSELLNLLILKLIKDECINDTNDDRFEIIDDNPDEESEEIVGGEKKNFSIILETVLRVLLGTISFGARKAQSILDTIVGFMDISGGGLTKLINQVLQILKDTKKMGENANVGAYAIDVINFCVVLVDNVMKDWFEINMDMLVKHTKPYASVYNYDYNLYAIDESIFNEDMTNNIQHNLKFTNANGNKFNFPRRYVEHILVPFTLKQTHMFSFMERLLNLKDNENIKGLLPRIRNFQNNVACGIEYSKIDFKKYEDDLIKKYRYTNDAIFKKKKEEYELEKKFNGEKQIIEGSHAMNFVDNFNASIIKVAIQVAILDETHEKATNESEEKATNVVQTRKRKGKYAVQTSKQKLFIKIIDNLLAFFESKIDTDNEIKNGTRLDKIKYIQNIDILKSSDKMDSSNSSDDTLITEEYRFENMLYLLKVIRCGCVFQNKNYHPHPHYYYNNTNFEYYLPVIYPTTNEIMYSFCDFLDKNGENYIWLCNKMNKTDIKNNYEYGSTFTYPITSEKISNNPICIIISPDHTEGFSFTFNPAILVPVLCNTAGDQDQVYGRILRKYGSHGQQGMYNKMVYQYCGGGVDDINNIDMISFINKLDENDLYSDAVNRNIINSTSGISSLIGKDMVRNAALPIIIGIQSVKGLIFNQLPYEWQSAAAYWNARINFYNQGYDEEATRLKNAIHNTTRIWNLGHISESRNLQELTKIISLSKLYFDKFLESENISYLKTQIMIGGKNITVTLIKPIDLEFINENNDKNKSYCKTSFNNILCINHIENFKNIIEPELNEEQIKRRELLTGQRKPQSERTWVGYFGERIKDTASKLNSYLPIYLPRDIGGRTKKKHNIKLSQKRQKCKKTHRTINKYRSIRKYQTIHRRKSKMLKLQHKTEKMHHKTEKMHRRKRN